MTSEFPVRCGRQGRSGGVGRSLQLMLMLVAVQVGTACNSLETQPEPSPLVTGAGNGEFVGVSPSVSGTVSYRERIALPPDAVVEVTLADVSLMDVPAELIAKTSMPTEGRQVPISFEVIYDPARIDERHTYAVRAVISREERMLFTTDTAYHVITQGSPNEVDLLLVKVAAPSERPAALTYGCDDPAGEPFTFGVRFREEAVELRLPERFHRPASVTLSQVRAGSGSKYKGDGILFWIAGEEARFDVDGESFGPCAERPADQAVADPWAQARSDGVAFRALGQEPFWKLDIIPERWMNFQRLGEDGVFTPVPEAESDAAGQTGYHAITEAHDLKVVIDPTVCYDSMSGAEFEATVVVTLDGKVFHGCGRTP